VVPLYQSVISSLLIGLKGEIASSLGVYPKNIATYYKPIYIYWALKLKCVIGIEKLKKPFVKHSLLSTSN